jgi:hypothetical protein
VVRSCAAVGAACALFAGAAASAHSQTVAPGVPPAPAAPTPANPLAGDGMWIWYVSKSGGTAKRIAGKAKRRGIEVVLIKSGDAGGTWSQFSPELVSSLQARGLKVCAWQFVYGDRPKAEAKVGAASVAKGADCLVIDAEGHYEGEYREASTYMAALRARVGADYPLGLSSFPYTDYHPAFPYSVFLGPGAAQYNMPQLYWKTIGDSVDDAFVHTWVFNRAYDRPILPTGQTYLNPKASQVRRFRRLALAHGMEGVSWWSWQHSRNRQWKAVSGNVAPIPAYRRYDSFPLLRPGAKGDLVAWAQQLLAGGGFATPVSGYFLAPTRSAVAALQASRGLPQTGSIDVATWNVLLTHTPLKVRWTERGAVAASAGAVLGEPGGGGAVVLPEPRSAGLEARAFEIPPLGGSDRP